VAPYMEEVEISNRPGPGSLLRSSAPCSPVTTVERDEIAVEGAALLGFLLPATNRRPHPLSRGCSCPRPRTWRAPFALRPIAVYVTLEDLDGRFHGTGSGGRLTPHSPG
jgi:hypothetical protein